MGKYLIGNFVTEITPKFNELRSLLKPFEYSGEKLPEIIISVSESEISDLCSRMKDNTTLGQAEELASSSAFNRAIVKHGAMLIHSSALICDSGAYLFSAPSGVGKSTHTRLWLDAFGDRVKIINDDKPIVRICDNSCIVYGTPFDGGSGIAVNDSAPLKAIVFIERDETNSIRKATQKEIIEKLYTATIHRVNKTTAAAMLQNFDRLISMTDFYILACNTHISAAYTAYNELIANKKTV